MKSWLQRCALAGVGLALATTVTACTNDEENSDAAAESTQTTATQAEESTAAEKESDTSESATTITETRTAQSNGAADAATAVSTDTFAYSLYDGGTRYSFRDANANSWCMYVTATGELECGTFKNALQIGPNNPLPSCTNDIFDTDSQRYRTVAFQSQSTCVVGGENPAWVRGKDMSEAVRFSFTDLPVLQSGTKVQLGDNTTCTAVSDGFECSHYNYRVTINSGGLSYTA